MKVFLKLLSWGIQKYNLAAQQVELVKVFEHWILGPLSSILNDAPDGSWFKSSFLNNHLNAYLEILSVDVCGLFFILLQLLIPYKQDIWAWSDLHAYRLWVQVWYLKLWKINVKRIFRIATPSKADCAV